MCRPPTLREQAAEAWRWVAAHAIPLYLGAMFTAMAVVRFAEPESVSGAVVGQAWWPFVYFSTAHLIAAGLIWPGSTRLAALTGSAIVMVAVARLGAVGSLALPLLADQPAQAASGVVAMLLWGLVAVVGLRWPHLAHDAEVRSLIVEAAEQKVSRHGVG